jgi:hypothetical protein
MIKRITISVLFLLVMATVSLAQTGQNDKLFRTLYSMDSLLFNIGFNHGDTVVFAGLISDHFEMYHDEAGIISSKNELVGGISNFSKLTYKPKRKLIENSLSVYPLLKNGALYGAVQNGVHEFYSVEKDKPDQITSTAKFTHIWLFENGKWKLAKAISYDHIQPKK